MNSKTKLVSDLRERFIWLDGVIDQNVARKFKKMLARLNRNRAPVYVYVRGIGGQLAAAISIINAIEKSSNPVSTIAHDSVRSGCLLIAQSGHHRLAVAGTRFHFHPAAYGIQKNVDQLEQYELRSMFSQCQLSDAIQLGVLFKKSKSYIEMAELLANAGIIGIPRAKKLGLVDDYYKESDFFNDRKIARKLIRALK